jgi:beta-lactamase superfamily II metal-dependent hydrolase
VLLVDFINVGYGDAILVRERDGAETLFTLLVDAGDLSTGCPQGPSQRISAAGFLRREGVRRIDLLALSHLHLDHVGGLLSICDEFEVGELWTNCLPDKALWKRRLSGAQGQGKENSSGINNLICALNIYTEALVRLDKAGVSIRALDLQPLSLSLTAGLSACCFHADAGLCEKQDAVINGVLGGTMGPDALGPLDAWINDSSLRIVLDYQGRTIMLPGDVTAPYWKRFSPGHCDILKVPHHCHRDALDEELLEKLKPAYGVISVSNDRPDPCPNPDVLRLLGKYAKCFATDALHMAGLSLAGPHASVRFTIEGGNCAASVS